MLNIKKGYRCYHPPTHKLYVTLDVVFYEDKMYYSTPEMISDEDNQGNLQAPKDNLYHLDVISEKYYTEPQPYASNEMIQLELQTYTEDQIEVRQSEPQSSTSPMHNVPIDQVISEYESMPEPQVSSET